MNAWPFVSAPISGTKALEVRPLTAASMVGRYAQRMKRVALGRARWEKRNGKDWAHKRVRAVRDALIYRKAQHHAG